MKRIALSILFASTVFASLVPSRAQAQHKSPLADAPAIRKRVELRDKRFEIGVGAGSTLNETFFHDIMVSAHLAFHITDWLAIGGVGLFGVKALNTGFQDELTATLKPPMAMGDRAPSAAEAMSAMNKPSMALLGQIELTPFTGKFSLFGKLFAHYDFYIAPGVGILSLVKGSTGTAAAACRDKALDVVTCTATGSQPAGSLAGGFNAFINDTVAITAEVRPVVSKDNPAGRDVNGDGHADKGDLTWTAHWIGTLGVTVFLPPKADISN
jgi:outer membrane beta-barrel protein